MPRPADRPPEARRCPVCGGETRFSHVDYVGRGLRATMHRCAACGAVSRGTPRPDGEPTGHDGRPSSGGPSGDGGAAAGRGPRRSRKPPVDEGPPDNPVLDEQTASRLRDLLGD